MEDRLLQRVFDIAAELRDQPTAPRDFGSRPIWPLCHCAYSNCNWEGTSERELDVHLRSVHNIDSVAFASAIPLSLSAQPSAQVLRSDGVPVLLDPLDLYREAIAEKERNGIPKLGFERDRRSRSILAQEFTDADLGAVICFVCATVHVSTHLTAPNSEAWLRKSLNQNDYGYVNLCIYIITMHMLMAENVAFSAFTCKESNGTQNMFRSTAHVLLDMSESANK